MIGVVPSDRGNLDARGPRLEISLVAIERKKEIKTKTLVM